MVRLIKKGGAATERAAKQLREPPQGRREPATPSQPVSGLIRGEIDWIVIKRLEKDWTRRAESASGLSRDIERYLADEPVDARPPTASYRLRKAARKYRMALRVAGAFLLLLVAGVLRALAGHPANLAETKGREPHARPRGKETRPRRGVTSWRALMRTCDG